MVVPARPVVLLVDKSIVIVVCVLSSSKVFSSSSIYWNGGESSSVFTKGGRSPLKIEGSFFSRFVSHMQYLHKHPLPDVPPHHVNGIFSFQHGHRTNTRD